MEKDTIFTGIKHLRDPKSLQVKKTIEAVAGLNTNLLIHGETGVGTDFWANYLFHISPYEKMLNLNCGDVPENLLESEWFGYRRGAFTGADRDYEGKWRTAEGGILFLNQIDLLSLNLQSRLLRVIERKRYYPLGSNREQAIDARFIFSADADIEEKVRLGEFRQDLFYRISTYRIFIPPLRERPEDIWPLLSYFARMRGVEIHLSRSGIQDLLSHFWRGNIRELENFINTIAIQGEGLTDAHAAGLQRSTGEWLDTKMAPEPHLEDLEREYIQYLMKRYTSKVKVAEILGISRKSLYNKLKKYGSH
jgi:DNA-binding NtrC family response regulator